MLVTKRDGVEVGKDEQQQISSETKGPRRVQEPLANDSQLRGHFQDLLLAFG